MRSSRLALETRMVTLSLALLFGACASSCVEANDEERLPPDSGPTVGGGEVAIWHGDAAIDPSDAAEPAPDGG